MRKLLVIPFLLLAVSCGGGGKVTLHGTLSYPGTRAFGFCGSQMPLTGKVQVTVRDGTGTVIGTTEMGPVQHDLSSGPAKECTDSGTYSLEVPKADFYQLEVEGVAPAAPVSYDDLAARDFVLDLTVQ